MKSVKIMRYFFWWVYIFAWRGCKSWIYIKRFIYRLLNYVLSIISVAGGWEVGPVNQFNHNSWVAVVTPTHRHELVIHVVIVICSRNVWWRLCAFVLLFMNFLLVLGVCHMTWSDLFSLLLKRQLIEKKGSCSLFLREVNWLFNVTINDISVIYVTAHRCAVELKKK